jgi:hypothetical protein
VLSSKLFYYAAGFELGSMAVLFTNSSSLALLASYLVLHLAGSALLSLALSFVVPARYRTPRHWLLAYLFAFNFFIPMAGLICAAFAILLGAWAPRLAGGAQFDVTDQPRFRTHRNHEGTGFRGGQVRAQLATPRTPLDQRMRALVAVQDAPARATGDLLRALLSDPADDIRLLAYGILDGKEKGITQRILDLRQELERSAAPAERRELHKRLAELYWELAFQNLVQGDMQDFTIGQVRQHAAGALQIEEDAGLWFLLARLELRARDAGAAERALSRAQQCGFARERLLPYLAELRFLQGRFSEVRRLFVELADEPGVPALAKSRGFWLGRSVPVETRS